MLSDSYKMINEDEFDNFDFSKLNLVNFDKKSVLMVKLSLGPPFVHILV